MKEKKRMTKVRFGLTPRIIIGVIVIALVLTTASAYIGALIYWNDITDHYNQVARHNAQAVENVFDKKMLKEWSDLAYRYSLGQATDDEVTAVTESKEYKELKYLIENLNISNELNDIYIVGYDMDVSDSYTQEIDDAGEWNPLFYIMDTYYIKEDQYPLGTSSAIDTAYIPQFSECWVNGVDPTESDIIISYWQKGGLYILTGLHAVQYEGKTIALIGVEIPLPTLESDLKHFVMNIVVIDMIAMAVILIITIVLISFGVIRPIKRLSKEAKRFVEDKTEVSDKLKKIRTHDEVQMLAESIMDLESGIIKYIKDLTSITAEKERMSAELNIASRIQSDMMPTKFTVHKDVELYATVTPAKEMGGDFYDFFMLDEDRLALVMADVSGKGMPAALFMVVAKTLIENSALYFKDPKSIMEDVNNRLCRHNDAGFFVTVWLGILDLKTGVINYVNAGHEYPVVCVKGESVKILEEDNFPPLATMEDIEYEEQELQLNPGDRLLLYTDGVPEAKAPDGSRFGMDKLAEAAERSKVLSPEDIVNAINRDVETFTSDNDPFDDVTIMSVVWKGKGKSGN